MFKNRSNSIVKVNGTEYSPGQNVMVITTNSEGVATSGQILPYGTYEIKETKTSISDPTYDEIGVLPMYIVFNDQS